jgi:hypothetical protein
MEEGIQEEGYAMSHRTHLIILIIVGSIVISSCGAEPEQTPTIIERGNYQGRPFITELPIQNCDSDSELQTQQRIDEKYTHEVEILRAPNSKANPQTLADAVREHYQVKSLVEVASYTVSANVPPGSIFTYQVEWTEVWREGDIEIGEIDDSPEATYKFLESLVGGVAGINTTTSP